jgi:hypothetical protein
VANQISADLCLPVSRFSPGGYGVSGLDIYFGFGIQGNG